MILKNVTEVVILKSFSTNTGKLLEYEYLESLLAGRFLPLPSKGKELKLWFLNQGTSLQLCICCPTPARY